MINFLGMRLSRYNFVDSSSTFRKQKQIKLVTKLKSSLLPTYLHVKDTTLGAHSCGLMYKIVIQSPIFSQKSKLQQHKMVMDILSQDMQQIHAVNLKTRTPTIIDILSLNKNEKRLIEQENENIIQENKEKVV